MQDKAKITTGPNDRPRNETIAQTGPGLPDDSSSVEVEEGSVEKARESLDRMSRRKRPDDEPGAEGLRSARADEDTYD